MSKTNVQWTDICEQHAPKRKVKLRRQSLPWMSGALRHKMNKRYKALQKAKKERNNEGLWKEYRKLRNEVTAELRRAKSTYFAELANCQKINTRKYWKILNQASGKESNTKTIRAIKSDTGALVTNDREIANILQCISQLQEKAFRNYRRKISRTPEQPLRANSRAHRSNIPNRYGN